MHALSRSILASVLACAACGGEQTPERLGVAEHRAEAVRHERAAAQHQRTFEVERRAEAAGTLRPCFDRAGPSADLAGQPGEVRRPCWTGEQDASQYHLEQAAQDREEAARHRAAAAALERVESFACAGIGEEDLTHSPFFHRDDIIEVADVRLDGELHGAKVLFRKVPGLDAGWMRKAIRCHQARAAALGYPQTFMTYCPLMVAPVHATVEDLGAFLAVTLIARREREIQALVARTRKLARR